MRAEATRPGPESEPVAAAALRGARPRPRPTWGFAEGDEIAPGRSVLRRIGTGRRFETLLVWDEHRLGVLVAKLLRPDRVADPVSLAALRAEGELIARLAHPVIVRGFGLHADERFPHLVMEHLEGPTLDALLEASGPLALEQLLPLGLSIASALHYLAAEGVVHLDVKPSNIVMGAPPRLIDLSVARDVAEAALLRTAIGTDAYMAPEQAVPSEAVPVGPPADVFGLATALFEAVGGARPFTGEARFPQLTGTPGDLPRRTPPVLVELLHAALARDPAARPTAREFATGLEPLVAALPRRPLRR